jgi:histidine ammonia-lyase
MMNSVILNDPLTWREIAAIAAGATLVLSSEASARIDHGRALVEAIVSQGIRAYGVSTGVGALCNVIVDRDQQGALSRNLLMSHACGVGEALGVAETRAIMAAAINNWAHGGSGICPGVVDRVAALLNADCIPVTPGRGSIGYLSHMAHIALAVIGEGSVAFQGERIAAARALEQLALTPLALGAKDGLSLINGAPCATGLAALALGRLETLLDWADIVAAMTFENLGGQPVAFAPEVLAFRVSPGVAEVGRRLTAMLAGSGIVSTAPTMTQDAMSLRAIPQVHGAVRDAWAATGEAVDRELASLNDNPVVAGTIAEPLVYSQAHPITTGLALALDGLGIAGAKIAAMSERRIDRLVNPLVSRLPPFLAFDGGTKSGLMIAQYTALSLVSENRRLAVPASLDGGITSGLQEDEIPHGTPAALKALAIIDNFEMILAIELIAAAQAYEFQAQSRSRAASTDAVYRDFRREVPPYRDDRPLATDFTAAMAFLRRPPPVPNSRTV